MAMRQGLVIKEMVGIHMNETVPADQIDKNTLNQPESFSSPLRKADPLIRPFVSLPAKPGEVELKGNTVVVPNIFKLGASK